MYLLIIIAAFLFGLTWDVDYRKPYYEVRGYITIKQKLAGIEYVYTWAGPGFCDSYPPEWDLRRYK